MSENLSKSVQSLFSRTALGIKPGLEVVTALLEKLGNPQNDLKVIHVAGTNGKGSVCAMIESVLRASGLKTGLYTSPHLFKFNERFRINGQEISNADLEQLIETVLVAERLLDRGNPPRPSGTPPEEGIGEREGENVEYRISNKEPQKECSPPAEGCPKGGVGFSGRPESPPREGCPKGGVGFSSCPESPPREGCPTGGVGSRPATFFEVSTAMAFEYFKRQKVDYAIIETGMGGRWDATNVVQPVISVITRIALDHADYLGTDLEKIAWEKAGIIKEGVPVICGPMPVEAEAVVYKEAAEKKVPILGSDEAAFFQPLESCRTDQLIDIEASGNQYRNVRLPLGGSFQLENCGVAVATLEDLADLEDLRLQMKKGLETVKWPGRFQTLSMKPPILFDGAHNPNAAETLFQTLEDVFPTFGKTYVFGFMKDKDVEGILKALAPSVEKARGADIPVCSAVEKAFAITLPGERAMTAEEIVAIGKTVGLDIEPIQNIQPARDWVAEGKKRLLCFTGSLYLAAELRKCGFNF